MGAGQLKQITLILVSLLTMVALILDASGCASQKEVDMPIVLLTDYGSEDYRISQLKGIIYSNYPEARLTDASHSVPAFDIPTGAFMLDVAANEFPEKVVFIGIVAPYTQPPTKYMVLTTNKNQIFVLPDNGLVTHVAKDMGIQTVYEINNQALFEEEITHLVAERIEGKIGALIASGFPPKDVGRPLTSYVTLDVQDPVVADDRLLGTIVYVDHYGNAVTNISETDATEFGLEPGDVVQVTSLGNTIPVTFGTIYSDVPQGEEIVFVCSNLGMVQLSINLGNFADTYGVKAGTKIEIEK